jgi:hypothetical protein
VTFSPEKATYLLNLTMHVWITPIDFSSHSESMECKIRVKIITGNSQMSVRNGLFAVFHLKNHFSAGTGDAHPVKSFSHRKAWGLPVM